MKKKTFLSDKKNVNKARIKRYKRKFTKTGKEEYR